MALCVVCKVHPACAGDEDGWCLSCARSYARIAPGQVTNSDDVRWGAERARRVQSRHRPVRAKALAMLTQQSAARLVAIVADSIDTEYLDAVGVLPTDEEFAAAVRSMIRKQKERCETLTPAELARILVGDR